MPAWTIAQLKAADAAISSPANLSTAAATLNAQTEVLSAQNISWASVRDVLMNNFDWGTLVYCATVDIGGILPGGATQTAVIQASAMAIRECCIYGGTFSASVTADWNALVAAANNLTPANVAGISAASANAVVALRTPTVPVWAPPVTAGDVQTARTQ